MLAANERAGNRKSVRSLDIFFLFPMASTHPIHVSAIKANHMKISREYASAARKNALENVRQR